MAGCRERIQLRRRNRLRHHNNSCIFRNKSCMVRVTGGAGGAACLARLRAILSRLPAPQGKFPAGAAAVDLQGVTHELGPFLHRRLVTVRGQCVRLVYRYGLH